jgi:SAM-dependent methyltransferase
MPAVSAFDRARGPLARGAAPVSTWARRRRVERLVALAGIGPSTRIVDIGCGDLGLLALAPHLNVTGVDLLERPQYPRRFVRADATERLPFADNEFDLAYANSVIEHIPVNRRAAFASEVRRVARAWYVQTPAMSFPIEPHSLLPGAHWLPMSLRQRYWELGAGSDVEEIQILRRSELETLFGPAFRERLGPLTKSWIAFGSGEPAPG